ncbi:MULTISPECIES: cytochrome c oxidase subunit 3 family protein [Pseudomonas]|uniref:Heme-copper oxidase subunit III family profile domain-containing protein n=1 Tax=Pseudomonas fluorescens TaxID=294 RepID=A0A159ZWI1_PSEFL|nr:MULTISPECIES: cytochrome c oxidase subunit 3 family protein [Pseudomonas]AMZ71299.1 hypothetical protein TK06_09360 [Pseudomonas fluorescens]
MVASIEKVKNRQSNYPLGALHSSRPEQHETIPTRTENKHAPGEEGVFILVLMDMMLFMIIFCSYFYERAKNPDSFIQSQSSLSVNAGIFNTLILLTSSWFIVLAIRSLSKLNRRTCMVFILLTLACSLAFTISKFLEYKEKLSTGITMLTNDFFMFYYMITGLHFMHVLIGSIILIVMFFRIKNGSSGVHGLESSATFWHMVDLLWIIIFPLLYIMR